MTIQQGIAKLLPIFSQIMINQGFTDIQADEIKNVGKSVYNECGADGMKDVYFGVTAKLPALGSTLSKIWDGVGDWAD